MKKAPHHTTISRTAALIALGFLTACGSGSSTPPKGVKIGKPYSISGKTYYPAYDASYNETGLASWYGPGFHGSSTANGEKFNTHDLTAAHPTLPMPSLVRVTNLENGKTLVVRINDRGPFARGRIIDLSKESAQRLGVKGLSKVRVQYLPEESEQYIAAVAEGRNIDMFAFNDRLENEKNSSILAATAPSDQSFIIESSENTTQPGDTVSNAAPIISVSDIDVPAKKGKKSHNPFVREAMADEAIAPAKGGPVILSSPSMQKLPDEPVVAARETKAPDNIAPKAVGKGIMIQVGSFSQQANAEKIKDSVSDIADANVTKVDVGGHGWWRVQAGPFADNDEAMAALDKIRADGAPDARIIKQ